MDGRSRKRCWRRRLFWDSSLRLSGCNIWSEACACWLSYVPVLLHLPDLLRSQYRRSACWSSALWLSVGLNSRDSASICVRMFAHGSTCLLDQLDKYVFYYWYVYALDLFGRCTLVSVSKTMNRSTDCRWGPEGVSRARGSMGLPYSFCYTMDLALLPNSLVVILPGKSMASRPSQPPGRCREISTPSATGFCKN